MVCNYWAEICDDCKCIQQDMVGSFILSFYMWRSIYTSWEVVIRSIYYCYELRSKQDYNLLRIKNNHNWKGHYFYLSDTHMELNKIINADVPDLCLWKL